MKKIICLACLICMGHLVSSAQTKRKEITVGPALSEVPVGFSLLTHGDRQFVAYYRPDHQMMIASRSIHDTLWTYQMLPSKIGWDGHNSIAMKVDDDNQIHLSGNMHVNPLMYLRTERPLDITSFRPIHRMTGENENRVTYPAFMTGPNGEFIYHYRDGGSGNGNEIYNVYDPKSQTWSRLLDKPLMDGKGERNAYMSGPNLGPDNWYHLVWVWRDSYHCETNNFLSYARSRNLKDWESIDGKPVQLPITRDYKELWVDPVPVKGGLINGGAVAGFDSQQRLLITYQKFDKQGNNQAYITRFRKGKWEIKQLSDWNYRWYFSGGGGIVFEIVIRGARPCGDGKLRVDYTHSQYGDGYWIVDENSLKVLETVTVKSAEEKRAEAEKKKDGLSIRRVGDCGKGFPGKKFHLEYETLPPNRDRARTSRTAPTMLKVVEETIE